MGITALGRRTVGLDVMVTCLAIPPHNMVFTQGRGFVIGASFGLPIRSLRCRVLVCRAADTASLATRFLFGKLFCVAITFGFGEKRCRKNLPLSDRNQFHAELLQPLAARGW